MDEKGKKIRVLWISDDIRSPSGVGTQSNYICKALVESGKFQVIALGGGMVRKDRDMRPIATKEHGQDLIIIPVDGYGDQLTLRQIIRTDKVDIIVPFTDPRFFKDWLFSMEDEIRPVANIVYNNIWDHEGPLPFYNRPVYLSNDLLVPITRVTQKINEGVCPDVPNINIRHGVPSEVFKPIPEKDKNEARARGLRDHKDKFVIFYNSRNARRKMTGTLMFWFKTFLDKVGHDKAVLLMKTQPLDPHGQNLHAIIEHLGLNNGEVQILEPAIQPRDLNILYNIADVTISISHSEGHGLTTHESLSAGTPIIAPKTGGQEDQVVNMDTGEEYGVALDIVSRPIVGSQEIPFIYESYTNEEIVVNAMEKMYNMSKEERDELGLKGREYVMKYFSHEKMGEMWVKALEDLYEKNGSWETRKNYKTYELIEF